MVSNADDVRVLIVADDPLARVGLEMLVSRRMGYTVVGQVAPDEDLLGQVNSAQPEVVLWDLGLEPTLSLSILEELAKQDFPPVIALLPNEKYAAEILEAGAKGLLLRNVDAATLSAALNGVRRGLTVLGNEFSSSVVPEPPRETMPLAEELTPRELEVLRLLAEGLPNKSIAQRLAISEHTAKFHVNSIMTKLGARSRTEAAILATRLGLILL